MLRFDHACKTASVRDSEISIHLMLRFDRLTCGGSYGCRNHFNTSHVKVRLLVLFAKHIILSDFNTSHVKVRHYSQHFSFYFFQISIHLMLRFDKQNPCTVLSGNPHFNTSHVKVRQAIYKLKYTNVNISIHLMLRFDSIIMIQNSSDIRTNPFHNCLRHW